MKLTLDIKETQSVYADLKREKHEFDLVGIDGNAFMVMGYVRRALIESGHKDKVEEYFAKAKSGNYDNPLS